MPEYLSPGVYVEEIDTGNKPIEGVGTSTAGFVGIAERGPVTPTFISSFKEYFLNFGGYFVQNQADRYLTYAIEGFFQNGGKRCFIQRVVGNNAVPAKVTIDNKITVQAIGPGVWGNQVAVEVTNAGLHDDGNVNNPANKLFRLSVKYWDPKTPQANDPTIREDYDNLSDVDVASNFYEKVVNGVSTLITLKKAAVNRPANTNATLLLQGTDGAVLVDQNFKNGVALFENVDEIALLCCPEEETFSAVTGYLLDQCEKLKDRFAVLQAPQVVPNLVQHRPPRDSKYGAYYLPWLRIRHPETGLEKLIPPGGHITGIYARSDNERGVHKAPANEVIRGLYLDPLDPTRGLVRQVTKEQQDQLNPKGVNVLRYFPGRGNLVWGARTMAYDPDWKYVNVRRLFIFVEESIEEATQWVVFEPNDEPLWARVRRSVGDFLTRLWMDGMLQGRSKEEAFFVKCDRTTMTQADIDNGKLIMVIGIAPVKPAEFVIFRIGQWTGGSEVAE